MKLKPPGGLYSAVNVRGPATGYTVGVLRTNGMDHVFTTMPKPGMPLFQELYGRWWP